MKPGYLWKIEKCINPYIKICIVMHQCIIPPYHDVKRKLLAHIVLHTDAKFLSFRKYMDESLNHFKTYT